MGLKAERSKGKAPMDLLKRERMRGGVQWILRNSKNDLASIMLFQTNPKARKPTGKIKPVDDGG